MNDSSIPRPTEAGTTTHAPAPRAGHAHGPPALLRHPAALQLWHRVMDHRVVQWLLAYVAFAYTCLHSVDMLSAAFHWPELTMRLTTDALVFGFPVTGVLAWYFHTPHPGGAAAAPGTSAPPFNSIAVLPFIDMSEHKDQEYFSDGLTEELIGLLTKIPDLRVPARTSSFFFKGKQATIGEIAQALHVAHVLEGSVRKAGNTMRIRVQLIQVNNGYHLWSETYDRTLDDIFKVQDEIAGAVVRSLRLTLLNDQLPVRSSVTNADAYQLYLRGRFHWNQRSAADFRKAIKYFEQVIASDPKYALAYSGLADCYSLLPIYDRRTSVMELAPQAKQAAIKALSMDDGLAEAHASLGLIYGILDYDWLMAASHFKRAIELNPNAPTPHQWYGNLLVNLGRHEEGLTEMRRGIELDPLSPVSSLALGICLNCARHFDQAIAQLQKALELRKNFADTNYFLYEAYANKQMYQEAVDAYALQKQLDGETAEHVEAIKDVYATGAWPGFLRHRIATLESQAQPIPEEVASFHARLGDVDGALAWLEKSFARRSPRLALLKVDPRYDNLRSDPRFADLLRRVGLGDP